jgi:N-6 DNA Methylase
VIKSLKITIARARASTVQNAKFYYDNKSIAHEPTDSLFRYSYFLEEVTSAFTDIIQTKTFDSDRVHHLLNGGASQALQEYVVRETRVKFGMFFSGHRLASEVAKLIQDKLLQGAILADPACGAGDLLLACLSCCPIHEDINSTLAAWGERIVGLDIHEEMAATTRARIALLAAMRVSKNGKLVSNIKPNLFDTLASIRSGDYFAQPEIFRDADCIVMNPPFTEIEAPNGCSWSSGKVQQAAVFTESVVNSAKAGQEIVAVLPDVLRSGTRYGRWRQAIANSCEIKNLNVFGRFDPKTDVDVFILHLKKRASTSIVDSTQWKIMDCPSHIDSKICTVSDIFKVSVGAVVPHRHNGQGPWAPYMDVSSAPANAEVKEFRYRRFNGTLHKGPFVVIRRTSSPSDAYRATASLVNTREDVAVENHLIVLRPHDGTLKSCRKLISILREPYINDWLNITIRCRHLTVKAVKEIPITNWI